MVRIQTDLRVSESCRTRMLLKGVFSSAFDLMAFVLVSRK